MVLFGVMALPPGLGAQTVDDTPPLITDRPTFTLSAQTVPAGRLQIEGGYTVSRQADETTHSIGDLAVRYGVLRGVEARLGVNAFVLVERPGEDSDGFEGMSLGARLDAVELLGWPSSARLSLTAGTTIPSGGSETGTDSFQPAVVLSASFDLAESLVLGANAGVQFPVEDSRRYTETALSAVLAIGLSERWNTFVETYAILPDGSRQDELYMDAGVTFLASPKLQLDARIGSAIAGSVWPNMYVGIGASWRT